MLSKRLSFGPATLLAILTATLLATTTPATAQHELILHSFGHADDGIGPSSSLVFDAASNLYGLTTNGGTGQNCGQLNCGTLFELTPSGSGNWTGRILHEFTNNGHDGYGPGVALFIDSTSNLYGTTGGGYDLRGVVFELTPHANGAWSEQLLYHFNLSPTEGYYSSSLIMDSAGNLYGTGYAGGVNGVGTVFELVHQPDGDWAERILYAFQNNRIDGMYPSQAGLIFDAAGNLYGTTLEGGNLCSPVGCGTVFELSPKAGGGWIEKILHNFSNAGDGSEPYAGVIMDAYGNLYGTTVGGGSHRGGGIVFELIPGANGAWREKLLYSFSNYSGHRDGSNSYAAPVMSAAGNLYGTTEQGGAYGYGTVFELMPTSIGTWTEKLVHEFDVNGIDGINPKVSLILDNAGNLYGTTPAGGAYGDGTVFEITP